MGNMIEQKQAPEVFEQLEAGGYIQPTDVRKTRDGFYVIYKSLSGILAEKGILDFPDSEGNRLACDKFFDDWFLYAVESGCDCVYGLLKMREQEFDMNGESPADGDTPGVTVSFVSFECGALLDCLAEPTDENRQRLDSEINRVVALRGERHHNELKKYFVNPKSDGAYLIANKYENRIADLSQNGYVNTSERYREIAKKENSRLARFIESLNQTAGYIVCDHEKIYVKNRESLTGLERAAILATHTGNTSEYSFAAEVEYHARFLNPVAKIKIPFFGKSLYDSAIRADMSVGGKETEGIATFYRTESRIVKRQYDLHKRGIQTEKYK